MIPAARPGRAVGTEPGLRLWETDLASDAVAFLADHVVLGSAVMPAAGFVEQALLAAQHEGHDAAQLRHVRLIELLPIEVGDERAVQLRLEQGPAGALRFDVSSLPAVGGTVVHASGAIEPGPDAAPAPVEAIERRSQAPLPRKPRDARRARGRRDAGRGRPTGHRSSAPWA